MGEATRLKNYQNAFLNAEKRLYEDKSICKENKEIIKEFYTYMQRKLKRINGLRQLDNGSYRTLYCYITRLKTVNRWFNNKPWTKLTEKDILKVYDDVEDGKIKNLKGKPYEDRSTYYVKVMKGKPFEIAGVSHIAKKVIEYSKPQRKEVRFIPEAEFRKLINVADKSEHRLLLWLAFDYGENISSLLRLQKKHFYEQKSDLGNEPEYMLNYNPEILKRSRKSRSDVNNHSETYDLLKQHLAELNSEDYLFNIGYNATAKIIKKYREKTGVVCIPNSEPVTWKDLRSSMACDLLKKGWTTDEVNARLGHTPSSDEIDKYVNFLAIDKSRPKAKVEEFKLKEFEKKLEAERHQHKLEQMRLKNDMEERMRKLEEAFQMDRLANKGVIKQE